jgi:hypothetical protein
VNRALSSPVPLAGLPVELPSAIRVIVTVFRITFDQRSVRAGVRCGAETGWSAKPISRAVSGFCSLARKIVVLAGSSTIHDGASK